MSRYRGLSLLFWVLLDAGVRAAISITFPFGEPTPGIPGYRTRTLKAVSSPGTKIIGFNLDSSGGTGFGIYSPLNQVNPLGLPSVFNDNPAAIFTAAGADIKQDSHFLVKATDGLAIHGAESG